MTENDGFVRLGRGYFGHFLWAESRKYSRAEAWLDLLQKAAFKTGPHLIQGHVFAMKRGSLVASVRWLSDRWRWSNTKVCQFLDLLRDHGMITTETQHGITVIFLCQYEIHNPTASEKNDAGATSGRQENDPKGEGKERGENLTGKERAASEAELVSYCASLGLPERDGVYLWNSWQASGWMRGGHPITNWRACVRAWQTGEHLPSQKRHSQPFTAGRVGRLHDPTGTVAAQY